MRSGASAAALARAQLADANEYQRGSCEQKGAGLDACSPAEFAHLQWLNASYNAKFGFPFILAVRGYDRVGIIERFAERLDNSPEAEFEEALNQIARIAALRIVERVA